MSVADGWVREHSQLRSSLAPRRGLGPHPSAVGFKRRGLRDERRPTNFVTGTSLRCTEERGRRGGAGVVGAR